MSEISEAPSSGIKSGHKVTVGDMDMAVDDATYFLATLPKNTPIEWRGAKMKFGPVFGESEPETGAGILLYTWWYDGLVAEVDMCGKRVVLHPESYKDFRVWLADASKLNLPMTCGDGI